MVRTFGSRDNHRRESTEQRDSSANEVSGCAPNVGRRSSPRVQETDSIVTSLSKQVHLRLRPEGDTRLRQLADRRGQTLSGAVRYLLRLEERTRRPMPETSSSEMSDGRTTKDD